MADLSRRIARQQEPAARRRENLLFLTAIGIVGAAAAGSVFAAGLTLLLPTKAVPIPPVPSALEAGPAALVVRTRPAAARRQSATDAPPAAGASHSSRPAMTAASAAVAQTPPAVEPKAAAAPRSAPAATAPASFQNRPSVTAVAALGEGDAHFRDGEISVARFDYERAFDAGDAEAAVRLGETFDPAFLAQGRLRRVRADPAAARYWYRRAADLGSAAARDRLAHLDTEPAGAGTREAAESRPVLRHERGASAARPTFHELLERILHPPP